MTASTAIEAAADAFGGRHVSAGEFRADAALDLHVAAARLRTLAARLAGRGLLVAVEAFPWSALPDPATAGELLRRAAAPMPACSSMSGTSQHGGGNPEQLTGPVVAVQLNDGPRVSGDYLTHARAARRLPGDGDLDVVGLLRAVLRTGFTGPWCVESTPRNSARCRSSSVTCC